jgi:hypothetical protein
MVIFFAVLAVVSALSLIYFLVGVIVPSLPLIRSRKRAGLLAAISLAATVGFVIASSESTTPEQRAVAARERAIRDRATAERRAAEQRAATSTSSTSSSSVDEVSVAYKLAVLQTKSPNPSATLVSAFDKVLTSLEQRCRQSRFSSPSLGDMAVASVRILEKAGSPLSLLDVLRAVDLSVSAESAVNVDCAVVIAKFVAGVQEGLK